MTISPERFEKLLRVPERVPVGMPFRIRVTFENSRILDLAQREIVYLAPEDTEGLFKVVRSEGEGLTVVLTIQRVEPAFQPPEQNIITLYAAPKAT